MDTMNTSSTGVDTNTTNDMNTGRGVQDSAATGGSIRPEHDTDKTGITGMHSDAPKVSDEKPTSSATATGGAGASAADPASGQRPGQKQQGADRPGEEPVGEAADAVREKKAVAEDGQAGNAPSGGGAPLGQGKKEDSAAPKQDSGKDKGMGTKYEKSTGMASQGGDFDATRPGAGREADRKSFLLCL